MLLDLLKFIITFGSYTTILILNYKYDEIAYYISDHRIFRRAIYSIDAEIGRVGLANVIRLIMFILSFTWAGISCWPMILLYYYKYVYQYEFIDPYNKILSTPAWEIEELQMLFTVALIFCIYSFMSVVKLVLLTSKIVEKEFYKNDRRTEFGSAYISDIMLKNTVNDYHNQQFNYQKNNNQQVDIYKGGDIYIGGDTFIDKDKKTHVITFAPTRSGKGTCLIIPNLIYGFKNSYVVLDIKGENAAVTARKQKQNGADVIIIDPWGIQDDIGATHGIPSMGFNPLMLFSGLNDNKLIESCSALIDLFAPIPKDIREPYWIERARVLIRGLLIYHLKTTNESEWSLLAVYKMLRGGDDRLMAYIAMGADTVPLAADDLNQFRGKKFNESPYTSILSQAQSFTDFIRSTASNGEFNPKQLTEKPTAVYICIPDDQVKNNYTWLRMVIGYCMRGVRSNLKNKKVDRTIFLLDEAHYLGEMEEIKTGLATSATYGICIWQFYQDIGQVQSAYGKSWHSIMNVGIKQFYKISDLNTKKYVSEYLGDKTIEIENESINHKGEISKSKSAVGVKLLKPEEVGNVSKIITIIDNKNYLLEAIPYFKNNDLHGTYDKNPVI